MGRRRRTGGDNVTREREGGTGRSRATAANNDYSAVLNQQRRGCAGLHRGQLVSIKGEPGLNAYRVLAVDPVRGAAVIARADSNAESWRLPVSVLEALELTRLGKY